MENLSGERKRRKIRQNEVTAIQKLYETCKEVFADCGPGIVPSADGIERLKGVLDEITESDVGIHPNMPFLKVKDSGGEYPRITYLHLCGSDKFWIGIFLLPPAGVIPLHNHPQMTVFSKLLFGTMHITAYDWADDDGGRLTAAPKSNSSEEVLRPSDAVGPVGVRLAKVKVDSDFTAPCETSILFPADGGNMHCFTALTPCAVLDVLGPPYSDAEGRHCQYYRTRPFSDFSVVGKPPPEGDESESHVWLEEIEQPEGFMVAGAMYTGPRIVE